MSYTAEQRLQAAQWFFDIHDTADPTSELLHQWLQWMDAAEGNRLAFEAVEAAYYQTTADPSGAASGTREGPSEFYDGETSVAAWRAARVHHSARPRRVLRYALAAAVVLLVLGFGGVQLVRARLHPASGVFVTRTSEHMQLVLADGSRVQLGARSRLEIQFSSGSRDVRLVEGEAFFRVQKDPRRAFRVHALEGVITAVGTEFDVRTTVDRVTVAVSEGAVNVTGNTPAMRDNRNSVSSDTSPSGHMSLVRLGRGEQLTFTTKQTYHEIINASVSQINPAQSARWRDDGWLVYRDEPLRYVIADVERYTERPITVTDSVAADLRFTGAVFKDSVVEWVQALPEVFPIVVNDSGQRLVVMGKSTPVGVKKPE